MLKKGNQIYFKSKYPDVVIPQDKSFTEFVLESLAAKSNSPCIINGVTHREYNNHELVDLIYRAASGLHKLGVKKGDIVGFLLPNIPEYLITFHATLLLGATVSLVNPEYTSDEVTKTLGTVEPSYLITIKEVVARHNGLMNLRSILPNLRSTVLINDITQNNGGVSFSDLTTNDGTFPKVKVDPMNDTAIIPFSSGTTGLYKGVCLTHYNIISNVVQTELIENPASLSHDVIMGVLPLFHIYGCMLFFGLYMKLARPVVLIPKFEPNLFLSNIQRYKVTIAYIVPPLVLFFAKSPLIEKFNISSLRILFSGAAPLSEELESLIIERYKNKIYIKQGYGMTETSPATHVGPFGLSRPGSAGLLVPNMTAKIVSTETGECLGQNERGELCLAGPNIMKGYYNNPKATADCIKDGFLHTGDICYVDIDGYFFIVDRVKELIKYKGFQVPPAELEGLLLSHPQVMDVCVVGVPDGDNGEVPRAFIVLKPGNDGKVSADDINNWINPKISNPKRLRGGIFFISQIPKSPTGKLLRKELKKDLKSKL